MATTITVSAKSEILSEFGNLHGSAPASKRARPTDELQLRKMNRRHFAPTEELSD
jgi:hypothetical protein